MFSYLYILVKIKIRFLPDRKSYHLDLILNDFSWEIHPKIRDTQIFNHAKKLNLNL